MECKRKNPPGILAVDSIIDLSRNLRAIRKYTNSCGHPGRRQPRREHELYGKLPNAPIRRGVRPQRSGGIDRRWRQNGNVTSRPHFEFVEQRGEYRLHVGRIAISQSTLLLAAAMLVGIGGGYGAVAFRKLIDLETWLALGGIAGWAKALLGPVGILIPLMLGGALVTLIIRRLAPEAHGEGVPEVMAAVALHEGRIPARVIAVKTVASATTLGFGGSGGREGPIIQIGAAIGSLVGQLAHAPAPIIRTLVACGAAAGVSATFNAPIGGVFFASEVILGEFAPRSFAVIVVASVVSAVIGRAYLGDRPSFDAAGFRLVSVHELWLYALLGVVCAAWAAGFVKLLYAAEQRFERWSIHPVVRTSVGFGLVGLIGIFYPQLFGVGYNYVQQVLYEHVPLVHATMLALLKPIATAITLGSGGSGGAFSPALYTGAMVGDAFGAIVHGAFPAWTGPAAAYGLVAMAAFFGAASEAPITAITIVFELSTDYTIILPLMISTVIATVLGRRFIGSTIYQLKLEHEGIDWKRVRHPSPFAGIAISRIARAARIVAAPDDLAKTMAQRCAEAGELALPITENGRYVGIVTAGDLVRAALGDETRRVDEIMRTDRPTLSPSDSLEQAMALMADPSVTTLAVVEPATGALAGVVNRGDLVAAQSALLGAPSTRS
ncbi:CBS domain-containing protein [bacterium]|nr:MAG: CBS domain-containing protein [bacterium]